MTVMDDLEQKVIAERDELRGRIGRLTEAIDQQDVRDKEFVLMSKQLGAMRQYLMFLQLRIARVEDDET